MAELPKDRGYTKEHEWALEQDGRVLVGITEYAQDQLGDVVFVQLPEAGTEVQAGQPLGEVESTKSVSDIYSPLSGKVLEKNTEVETDPELINKDPYGAGWLVALESTGGTPDLMSAAEYQAFIDADNG
ncbi:MAG: glycine cleavage system protein GcvH [Actinomycetota bacterium]